MRFFTSKKYSVFPLALLAVFGVAILLPRVALAQFGLGFIDGLGKAVEMAIAGLLLSVPTAILGIASAMLTLATDPSFIRIPYTTGPIIDTGWVVVRDFANMLIVFFLIIIGLATALRQRQYEAQVTLRKLVGVALLINFTPVITGFIVDTSNIFMNFFLEGLAGAGIIANVFGSVGSIIGNDLSIGGALSFIPKILLIGIFEVFAAIVFFLFATLFIVRRLAIWLLVILSPIAFVASILPKTNKLFDMWWNQFFQWSIIGVFAAFFLWLGDQIIGIAAQGTLIAPAAPGGGGVGGFLTDTLNTVMPFGIALAMLLIGFFVALQSSAMGSGAVQAFATKGMKWGGATAATPLWRRFGGIATNGPGTITGWGNRLQDWAKEKRSGGGLMAGVGAAGVVAGWGLKTSGAGLNSNIVQALPRELTKQVHFRDKDAFDKGVKEVEKMGDSKDVFNTINTELLKPVPNKNRILGLLTGVRNRGDSDDIQDAFDPNKGGLLVGKKKQIGQGILVGSRRIGPLGERPLLKAFYGSIMNDPSKWGFNVGTGVEKERDAMGRVIFKDIERDANGNTVFDKDGNPKLKEGAKSSDVKFLERMKLKIPARMTPEDFKGDEISPNQYNPETEEGRIFLQSMAKERGAEFMGMVMRRREQGVRQKIIKFYNDKPNEWFIENGAEDVLKWYSSPGAHTMGFSRSIIDPKTREQRNMEVKDVERLIQEHRPSPATIKEWEQSLAGKQKELVDLRRPNPEGIVGYPDLSGGVTDLSEGNRAKILETEQEAARIQELLGRARSQSQPPPAGGTPPPSSGGGGGTSPSPGGGPGPGGGSPPPTPPPPSPGDGGAPPSGGGGAPSGGSTPSGGGGGGTPGGANMAAATEAYMARRKTAESTPSSTGETSPPPPGATHLGRRVSGFWREPTADDYAMFGFTHGASFTKSQFDSAHRNLIQRFGSDAGKKAEINNAYRRLKNKAI